MSAEKRKYFLKSFLSLLGAMDIRWGNSDENKISGTVIYPDVEYIDKTESGFEEQDFCWHMTEANVPSDKILEIIQFIKENNLIDIDKVIVSPEELFLKMEKMDFVEFDSLLDELCDIQVRMVDDGEETDSFFVHFENGCSGRQGWPPTIGGIRT